MNNQSYYIYDPFLLEYMRNTTIIDFLYQDAKECYNKFLEERQASDVPSDLVASARVFNKAISDKYPTLTRNHVYRKGQNRYVWVVVGE